MSCSAAADLGAYVLGALEPDERRRVEEHLETCPACAAELAEFAPLPALLDRARPEHLQPVAVTPSPDLFRRMSEAAGTRPARRTVVRRRWFLAAAAALVVLGAAAGVTAWVTGSPDRGVTAESVTATSGPVQATVVATAANEGSALDVAVAGLRPGEICRLVAIDRDGARHPAGEWPVSPEGDGQWRGWADVDRSELAGLVLLGDGDRELLRVPL